MIREYYQLTKPGIVYGNAITAFAAFLFASRLHINFFLLIATLLGLMLVIASSCVINNIIDRDIDLYMKRTSERALVTGRIPLAHAYVFAFLIGAVGIIALLYTNLLTLGVTLFGVVVYLCVYTPVKRISRHSTILGALAGAVPPVVGYTAVTNTFDTTALMLFLILVCWQMVHFLAIAIFRKDEYQAAGLPVMPVRFSTARTKVLMIAYACVFAYSLYGLYVVARLGMVYAIPMGIMGTGWVLLAVRGGSAPDENSWAKKMFFYSLIILLVFCVALSLSPLQMH